MMVSDRLSWALAVVAIGAAIGAYLFWSHQASVCQAQGGIYVKVWANWHTGGYQCLKGETGDNQSH